jgi:hypothetical protein
MLARILVFLLCVGAVALVAIILSRSGFSQDRISTRAIWSAVLLILFSLVAAAGANLFLRPGRPANVLGYLTVGVAVVAFAVTTYSAWTNELFLFGIEKRAAYSLLFGFVAGGASVLVATGSDRAEGDILLARVGALLGLLALASIGFLQLTFSDIGISAQAVAVAAVVFALGTISLALLTVATEPASVAVYATE